MEMAVQAVPLTANKQPTTMCREGQGVLSAVSNVVLRYVRHSEAIIAF
jgi:hypothetical protein